MPKAKAKKKAVISGVWDRPVTALPDAHEWPTWGALRERVLISCRKIKITYSPTLRDAFPLELFKLSPPKLEEIQFRGCGHLRQLVLSPLGSCPSLKIMDLSDCESLEYVFLQSFSLAHLELSNCKKLKKALIHCPDLETLGSLQCSDLQTVMVWSNRLTHIDLTGADDLRVLKIQCPNLKEKKHPPLKKTDNLPIGRPPVCHLIDLTD